MVYLKGATESHPTPAPILLARHACVHYSNRLGKENYAPKKNQQQLHAALCSCLDRKQKKAQFIPQCTKTTSVTIYLSVFPTPDNDKQV
jgi:hypothetical protein